MFNITNFSNVYCLSHPDQSSSRRIPSHNITTTTRTGGGVINLADWAVAAASPPAPLPPGPLPPSFVCPFNYENYVGHFYIPKTCQVGLKCPGTMILTLAGHSWSVTIQRVTQWECFAMKLSRNWKHLSVMAEANKRIVIMLVQGGLVSGDSRPYTDTLFFCFDKFWIFENFLLNPGFLMCHGSIASERHFKKFVNNLILLFILQSKLMVSFSLFPSDPDPRCLDDGPRNISKTRCLQDPPRTAAGQNN